MFELIISLYGKLYIGLSGILHSYGVGILLLSGISAALMYPLVRYADRFARKERKYQSVIMPLLRKLREEEKGDVLHKSVQNLYKRYGYHPFYAIRQILPLFVQLPFLIATYFMLSDLPELSGQAFLFVSDLGAQDKLVFGLNLFPIVMTLANIAAALTLPGIRKSEALQAMAISLLFLLLLYNANAGILIYWTCNNLILLARNISSNPQVLSVKWSSLSGNFDTKKIYQELPRIFLVLSFVFCFLAVQNLMELAAHDDTPTSLIKWVVMLSGMTLIAASIGTVLRKYNMNMYMLMFGLILIGLIAGWGLASFDQLKSSLKSIVALIFYFDTWPVYIAPALVLVGASVLVARYFQAAAGFSQRQYIFACLNAVIAAFAFHWLNNSAFLYSSTVPVYFLTGAVFALCFGFLSLPFVRPIGGRICWEVVGAAALFAFVMLPTVHAVLIWSSFMLEYACLFGIFYFLFKYLYNQDYKILHSFYLIFFVVNVTILGVQRYSVEQESTVGDMVLHEKGRQVVRERISNVLEKLGPVTERPNIYFLVAESMTDLDTLDKLGVDTTPLRNVLTDYDFSVYPNTFTLGEMSLSSMSKTLGLQPNLSDGDVMRRVVAGQSIANVWLQDIGYETAIIAKSYMTGIYNAYDHRLPEISVQAGKIDFLLMLLRGIGLREFKFDIEGFAKESDKINLEKLKVDFIKNPRNEPFFMLFHGTFPGHSQNSGKCLPNETEIYIKKHETAVSYLERDFKMIKEIDPEGIIIVLGDHGPYLTGNCHTLNYENPDRVQELDVRDRIGSLFAVHWPNKEKASKFDHDVVINQDIFPILFSYLYDSEVPLDLKLEPMKTIGGKVMTKQGLFPLSEKN